MVAKAAKKTSGPKKTSVQDMKSAGKVKSSGKTSGKKAKKVVDPVSQPKVVESVPDPVPDPVTDPVTDPVSTIVDPVSTDDISFTEDFTLLLNQLKSVQTMLRDLTAHAAKLERRVSKESKLLQKKANGKVKRKHDPNRAPSGFSKPGPVSKELLTFLQAQKTTMTGDNLIARTDVTKAISDYCRNNGLQDQKDKRKLNADKTLVKLLRLKKGEELTFFNLQKFMKVHFPNKEGVYPTA